MLVENTTHCGDCLELLKALPDSCVDLTVTSPPYDNLRTYNDDIDKTWGENVWKRVITDLFRVTKQGGVVVWIVCDATINGSETGTSFKQALHAMELGFRLHDTMIYQKTGLAFPDAARYWQSFEYMFIFSKGKPEVFNAIKDRKNKSAGSKVVGKARHKDGSMRKRAGEGKVKPPLNSRFNVWQVSNSMKCGQTDHPATFPLSLAQDHIISWSNSGDIVLDPFMGSGTTGVAAIQTGRRFIGMEISEEYCKLANERCAAATKGLKLSEYRDGQQTLFEREIIQ